MLGSIERVVERIGLDTLTIGLFRVNYLVAAGYVLAFLIALFAIVGLVSARHRRRRRRTTSWRRPRA